MASMQRISLLTGMVSMAAIAAGLPVQAAVMAEQVDVQAASAAEVVETEGLMAQAIAADVAVESSEAETAAEATAQLDEQVADAAETVVEPLATEVELTDAVVAESELTETEVAETTPVFAEITDESISTSATTLLNASEAEIALVDQAEAEAKPIETSQTIAQGTRPFYRGIAPFYLGIGGNIGVGDDDASAVGDFAFAAISKISLGPRFALRPSLLVSENDTSLAVPLTYNLRPVQKNRFTVAPFIGAGVDIAFDGDTGLLLNGGLDVPLSRQFTFNSQANFRITDDFSAGLILGVAYNLPIFFE